MASAELNARTSDAHAAENADIEHLRGKRVAVVVFSYYPSDPRPRRAAEVLVQLGMSVDVICLKQKDDEPGREVFNGVRITRIPLRRWRGGKFSYVFQYAAFILASFFLLTFRSLRRRYDLVHVHNMPDVLVFAALVPKILGAKVILDLHDPMPELMMTIFGLHGDSSGVRILQQLEKWSLRFADAVLTVNLACKKLFTGRGCPPEKVIVVMNSPDEGIFKCRELTPVTSSGSVAAKPFVIMYHGSLVERHGLDLAVRALGTVRRSIPHAEIRVYGQSTPFLEQVMDSARDTDLSESVRYLGPRNLEQIVEAIDGCDVGIIPNRRSIFTEINTPTRIFEYLSRGKPVIAPAAPGIRDYFGDQELIFFELGDANDLARKIEYVFLHPEEIGNIVRLGREVYFNHKWSTERMRFVNVVRGLLSADGRMKRVPASAMRMAASSGSESRSVAKNDDVSAS